ncbi:LrgA-associated membrane protein LrgB [Grimontia indica]|uniref:LrgA-associated membrane protein LrgB n=1 Tax=Grimontia indica TaxID=1056512 RepID=R1GQ62_9GAMM|nr:MULTISPECIES: LrgB family protein [Grimontia]EOD78363.1 LrgA-associated membrane protein LrgB [Grimontia indica]
MWIIATLIVYAIARQIALKLRHPVFNPLLISLIVLMPMVIYSGDTYQIYFEQNQIINFMLGPAVIALAYPLYEQMHVIHRHWRTILIACTLASFASMILGSLIAVWVGGDLQIAASVLPKSVSTPFALSTAEHIGGIPAVTAALVVVAGLFGALIGYPLLNALKVKSSLARGLSIGAVSHAIGTAKAAESNYQEGAMSSLALVICGIITTILAPFVYPIIVFVINYTTT